MSEEMRIELKSKSMKKVGINQQLKILKSGIFSSDDALPDEPAISATELREIDWLVQLCRNAYNSNLVPVEVQSDKCPASSALTAVIFASAIRRVFCFLQSVPHLEHLHPIVRMSLLKQRGMEAVVVLSSLTFNVASRMWTRYGTTLVMEPRPVHVCAADFERLHGSHVTRKHLDTV